ncbi:MAG: ester cyclase [Candidatus Binataceae bacterium]
MSVEDSNKALVRRYFDFLNQSNLPSEEFLSPAFVFHDPGMPNVNDLASVRQFIAACNSACPDQRSTIQDIIAEGDKVVCRWSASMTHEGDFMGIPATGKHVTLTGISIYRILGGKLEEEWNYADTLGLMRQLGVIAAQ